MLAVQPSLIARRPSDLRRIPIDRRPMLIRKYSKVESRSAPVPLPLVLFVAEFLKPICLGIKLLPNVKLRTI